MCVCVCRPRTPARALASAHSTTNPSPTHTNTTHHTTTTTTTTKQKWYWYELWHPTDHVESKNRIATPTKGDALRPRAQTLIHERYVHAPSAYGGPNTYETDAWFTVLGQGFNWAAKRQEIALFTQGYQAWTLILSLAETAAGGVITAELILGVPAQGSDPVNPTSGLPLAQALAINEAAFIPYFKDLQAQPDAGPGFDAMSRHVVEEFSNLVSVALRGRAPRHTHRHTHTHHTHAHTHTHTHTHTGPVRAAAVCELQGQPGGGGAPLRHGPAGRHV